MRYVWQILCHTIDFLSHERNVHYPAYTQDSDG